MLSYILKRLLLIIPTLLGALTITFIVIQFVPGGPVETLMAEARAGQGDSGYKAGRDSEARQVAELKLLEPFRKELPPEVFGPAFVAPRTNGDPKQLRQNLSLIHI